MYNDELDYALESAYEDGYRQALADMGYEFDDAEEDVDMFDADYFNEAMEGNKFNKALKNGLIQTSVNGARDLPTVRTTMRSGSSWDRNVGRRTPSSDRERRLDGNSRRDINWRNEERDDVNELTKMVRSNAEKEFSRMKKGKMTPDDRRRFDKFEAKMYHARVNEH